MTAAIEAIFLDFYGTVSGGDRRAVERACFGVVNDFGLDVSPAAFAETWGERFFAMIETCNADRFLTLREIEFGSLRETLGTACDGADLSPYVAMLEAYWADPPIHADAREFLARLNVPVCCVSNADNAPLGRAIVKNGLSFDAVVTSESAKSYKPHNGIFDTAIKVMGCGADRTLHIGDSLHSDIGGAQAAGMRAVWICRDDRIHDIGDAKPDHTVTTLMDILPMMASFA